jgi:hypothetical protein
MAELTSLTLDVISNSGLPPKSAALIGRMHFCGDFIPASTSGTTGYPTSGGTGTSGTIQKGNTFYASQDGFIRDVVIRTGNLIVAAIDGPGQTASSWRVIKTNPTTTNVYRLEDYGGSTTAGVDNTAAFNAILALIPTGSYGILQGEAATYDFMTEPNNITNKALFISGSTISRTVYRKRFNGAANTNGLFTFLGDTSYEGLGSSIKDCTLQAYYLADGSTASSGGHLLGLIADSDAAPDFFYAENVNFNYSGSVSAAKYQLYIDGSARTTAPVGCRDNTFVNCFIFSGDATGGPVYAKSYVGLTFIGGGWYLTEAGEKSVFTGTAGVVGFALSVVGLADTGNISFDYANYANISAALISGDVENTANTIGVMINCTVYGTKQYNWASSKYLDEAANGSITIGGKAVNFVSPDKTFTLANGKKLTITMPTYANRALLELGTGDATSLELGRSMDATITHHWPNFTGTNFNLGSVVDTKFNIVKASFTNDLVLSNRTGSTQTVRLTIFGRISNIVEANI